MSDFEELQAAINAACASGETLRLDTRRTYYVDRELLVTSDIDIEGHNATLAASVPMRSVLALKATACINHLTINGGRVATHALYCAGAGQSHITRSTFMLAVKDGVLLDAIGEAGGNDCMRFERCRFQHNGRQHRSGTVRVSGGVVYGEGTRFTHMRPGDFLLVDGHHWLPVIRIDDDSKCAVAPHPPPPEVAEGASCVAMVGDGLREERFNDNNLCIHRDCLYRGNAGSGARFAGLYGPRVENGQSDFNGAFGFVVGLTGETSNVIGSSFRGCYFEDLGAFPWYLGYAAGCTIDTVNCAGEPLLISNPSFNWGTISNVQGKQGAVDPIGSEAVCNLPVSRVAIHSKLPPPAPNNYPSGTILFARCPSVGQPLAWQKYGASPYSEWVPFGRRES